MKDHNDSSGSHEPEIEILDIEEHAQKSNGAKPPKARHYKIRVDREKFTVAVSGMKGREILILARKTPPEQYLLNQKLRHGQMIPIGLEDFVDFTAPGIERFTTLPKDQTEGLIASDQKLRREFRIPEDDVFQLDHAGFAWETVNPNWFLVHGFHIPTGYNAQSVSVAVQIPSGYPTAQLDMAYSHPSLRLINGRTIPNIGEITVIDGQNYQRWSRHYSSEHPWLPGEYSVITHLQLIQVWLEREISRT